MKVRTLSFIVLLSLIFSFSAAAAQDTTALPLTQAHCLTDELFDREIMFRYPETWEVGTLTTQFGDINFLASTERSASAFQASEGSLQSLAFDPGDMIMMFSFIEIDEARNILGVDLSEPTSGLETYLSYNGISVSDGIEAIQIGGLTVARTIYAPSSGFEGAAYGIIRDNLFVNIRAFALIGEYESQESTVQAVVGSISANCDESASNFEPETIQPVLTIAYGETVTGVMDDSETATYTFTGNAGDSLIITMSSEDFDPILALRSSTGQLLIESTNYSGGDAILEFTLTADGTYTIVPSVFFEQQDGEYQISVEENPSGINRVGDPSVRLLAYDQPAENELMVDGADVDYQFYAQEGDLVTITLDAVGFKPFFRLLGGGGIGMADTFGIEESHLQLQYLIQESRPYYIRVTGIDGFPNPSNGTYTLRVTAESGVQPTTAPDVPTLVPPTEAALDPTTPPVAADASAQGLIAFSVFQNGIWVINADGTQLRQFVDDPTAVQPVWSPDGSQMLFVSYRTGAGQFYLINADGSGEQLLVLELEGKQLTGYMNPAWSPDGSQIAFAANEVLNGVGGLHQIYIMNSDGTNLRRITVSDGVDTEPDWSPDGTKIIFKGVRPGSWEIYVMNVDGSNPQPLTVSDDSFLGPSSPKWSPDSSQIVFERDSSIYLMNADGSNPHVITNPDIPEDIKTPDWSPDGSQIVFTGEREGIREIYVMNVDGSGLRQLTQNSLISVLDVLTWQPFADAAQSTTASTQPPVTAAPSPTITDSQGGFALDPGIPPLIDPTVECDTGDLVAVFNEAQNAFNAGDWQTAVDLYECIVADGREPSGYRDFQDAARYNLFSSLQNCTYEYARMNRVEEAIQCGARAYFNSDANDPSRADYYFHLASAIRIANEEAVGKDWETFARNTHLLLRMVEDEGIAGNILRAYEQLCVAYDELGYSSEAKFFCTATLDMEGWGDLSEEAFYDGSIRAFIERVNRYLDVPVTPDVIVSTLLPNSPTLAPTLEPTLPPPTEVALAQARPITYDQPITGTTTPGTVDSYEFTGTTGQYIRVVFESPDACYTLVPPDNYLLMADADGDPYYGLRLPLDGAYQVLVQSISGAAADYTFTVVHDLGVEYGNQGILAVGGAAEVFTRDEGLKLRSGAGTDFDILETMPPGTIVEIIGGPTSSQGLVWWNVRAPSGNEGWSVEGADNIQTLIPVAVTLRPFESGEPFASLCSVALGENAASAANAVASNPTVAPPPATATLVPTPASCPGLLPSQLIIGQSGRVLPGDPNNIRAQPTRSANKLGEIPSGRTFVVLDGPVCADGYAWWQVDYNGLVGWTAESGDGTYWLEPVNT